MPRISLDYCYRLGRLAYPDEWDPTSFPTILEFLLALHEGTDDEAFRAFHRFLNVSEGCPCDDDVDSFLHLLDARVDIAHELQELKEELSNHKLPEERNYSHLLDRLTFILPAFEYNDIYSFDDAFFKHRIPVSDIVSFSRPMKAFRLDFETLRKEVIALLIDCESWLYGWTMDRFNHLWFDEDDEQLSEQKTKASQSSIRIVVPDLDEVIAGPQLAKRLDVAYRTLNSWIGKFIEPIERGKPNLFALNKTMGDIAKAQQEGRILKGRPPIDRQ